MTRRAKEDVAFLGFEAVATEAQMGIVVGAIRTAQQLGLNVTVREIRDPKGRLHSLAFEAERGRPASSRRTRAPERKTGGTSDG